MKSDPEIIQNALPDMPFNKTIIELAKAQLGTFAVNAEDIQRVVKQYLDPDKAVIVEVGQ